MSDFKVKYPADSVAVTITLASLATSSTRTGGAESDAISNRTNLDLDHRIGGRITTGTSPTVSKQIDIWIVPSRKYVSSTPTYPDVMDGTASAETWTSENVRNAGGQLLKSIIVDNTSDRSYDFAGLSVAALFGGWLPGEYVVFVSHDTAVNLNSTGGNHEIYYERVQAQSV